MVSHTTEKAIEAQMKKHLITEQDLIQYNANMKRIKVERCGIGLGTTTNLIVVGGRIPKGTGTAYSPQGTRRPELTGGVAPPPTYRSKWEAAYASKLDLEKHAGLIKAWWYEPFSLWLPGKVRYKPDFLIQYPDGLEQRLEIVEVKGWSKNRRDGMTRLKIAAAIFPCFVWRMVYRTKGGGWDGEYL